MDPTSKTTEPAQVAVMHGPHSDATKYQLGEIMHDEAGVVSHGSASRLGMAGHQSARADKDEWLTPPEIIQALGPFDLDPCAPRVRPWDMARQHFTLNENGLWRRWVGRVWLNPPYGSETGKWLGRLCEHGNGIALIFARTETGDWFNHVWGKAAAILFIKGRLHFHHVSGIRASANSGAPSALIAYGQNNALALRECRIPGALVGAAGVTQNIRDEPQPSKT